MEDISVPVVELKKEHGWTLEDASAYVAEIMCNREPLCSHEVCMILNTPAVTVLKELAQEEATSASLSRFFPDVRSGHFAVLLSAALLLKGGPGAPGTDSSHHFVKSLAIDLELDDDDADALRVGLDLLGSMPKFPRPTKERIALVVAYLAKYRDTPVRDLDRVLNQTNKFLKGEEGGSQFLDSMKDNLMNSFLAMERLMGCEEEGAARTATLTPKEGDIDVIDMTEQYRQGCRSAPEYVFPTTRKYLNILSNTKSMRTTEGGGCAASRGFVSSPSKVQTNSGQALGYHLSKFEKVNLGKTY
jgi:hypothetical protein